MPQPFFSEKLLCTAPDGTYSSFGGSKRISAFSDRLRLGSTEIRYESLIDLRVYGNVLHIVYMNSNGTTAEEYFRYDTFLPGKAKTALLSLLEYVRTRKDAAGSSLSCARGTPHSSNEQPRFAARIDPSNGRDRVVVYSARVSFPPICPTCSSPPTTVSSLRVSGGLTASGRWFIPVCSEHSSLQKAIALKGWTKRSSQLIFTFSNPEYAESFYLLNASPPENRQSSHHARTPLFSDIERGTRFVVYQHAIGVVFLAAIDSSGVKRIEPGSSRLSPGIPHTLITLALGWWAIPAGPIFTIRALVNNLRGGIDVTERISHVLRGAPVSAFGL